MDYSFNSGIATIYGVDEAILIHNIYWWIMKNEANGRHYYDGKHWTYNSMKAFAELFPFWTEKQVRRIIETLKNNGAIYVGNFNQKGFDRTQWYALSKEIMDVYNKGNCICPNGQMDVPKQSNAIAQMGTPIPDIKPYINTDINIKKESKKGVPTFDNLIDNFTSTFELKDTLIEFIKMRKLIKKPLTNKALELILLKLTELSMSDVERIQILNQSIMNDWQGLFALKIDSPPRQNSGQQSYERNYEAEAKREEKWKNSIA